MSSLTATQQSLIRRGLATPQDFGVAATAEAAPLTDVQQRLVRRGLARPEDFAEAPKDLAAEAAKRQAAQQGAARAVEDVDKYLRTREFEKQYDSEGPGLLGRLGDSVRRGWGNMLADQLETGWDPFGGQRIDPRTGQVETAEVAARRRSLESRMAKEKLPQQSLTNQRAVRNATAMMDAGNISGGLGVLARNPDAVLDVVGESLGYNAPSLAAAAATVPFGKVGIAGGLAAGAFSAVPLFATTRNAYINEKLTEDSQGDPNKRAELLADSSYMEALSGKATRYAATLSGVSAISRGLAGPMARVVNPTSTAGVAGTTALGAVAQTAMGGGGESLARRAAGDEIKASDVVMEMVGGAPMTAVDSATTLLAARSIASDNRQAILDAKTRAERLNTETARGLAENFSRGIIESSASAEQLELQLGGGTDVAPSVGGAIEAEARMEDKRVAETTAATRRAAAIQDELERELGRTVADDPGNIMANALMEANRNREITSLVAPPQQQTPTRTGQDPTQGDLFNVVTDPNIDEIEALRREVVGTKQQTAQKDVDRAASKAAAERRNFRRSYLEANPNATPEEILQAEAATAAARTPVLATAGATKQTAKARPTQRPVPSRPPADIAPVANQDPDTVLAPGVAEILKRPRTPRDEVTTVVSTAAKKSPGHAPSVSTPSVDMAEGDAAFADLLRQFEETERATISRNVEDISFEDAAADGNKYKAANIRGGVRAVFNHVAEVEAYGDTPIKGTLARRLGALVERVGVKLEFSDTPIKFANEALGEIAGLWVPGESKILVSSRMNERHTNETILHEGSHAVMQAIIRDPSKFGKPGEQAMRLVTSAAEGLRNARYDGRLEAAIKDVSSKSRGIETEMEQSLRKILMTDLDGLVFSSDGTVDLDEFTAYSLTNRNVQQVLRQLRMPGRRKKTLWDSFKDALRYILNFDGPDTVLDRVLQGSEGLISLAEQDPQAFADTFADSRQSALDDATAYLDAPAVRGPDLETPLDVGDRLISQRGIAGLQADNIAGTKGAITRLTAPLSKTKLGKALRRGFRNPYSVVPETASESLVNAEGLTQEGRIRLHDEYKRMRSMAKKNGHEWGDVIKDFKLLDAAEDDAMRAAVMDRLTSKYGEDLTVIFDDMRALIDQNSVRLIQDLYDSAPLDKDGNPVLSKDLVRQLNAIEANIGKYYHREYAIFYSERQSEFQKWIEDTPKGQEVLRNGIKYIADNDLLIPNDEGLSKIGRNKLERLSAVWTTGNKDLSVEELRAQLAAARDNPAIYNDALRQTTAERMAMDIVTGRYRDNPAFAFSSERADQSILKKRENVPGPIRELMGENADPFLRAIKTISEQDALIHKLQAFREIKEKGEKYGYVFDNVTSAPEGFVQLTGQGFGALTNKFVSPDIKALLDGSSKLITDIGDLLADPDSTIDHAAKTWAKAARGAKGAVLLFAAPAWMLNLLGSYVTVFASGHGHQLLMSPSMVIRAMSTVASNIGGLSGLAEFSPDAVDMFRRTINDPAMTGEMQRLSIQDAAEAVYDDEAFKAHRAHMKALTRSSGWIWDRLFDSYAAMDLWAKVFNMYAELANLRAFNEKLSPELRMSEEVLRRTAADRVRAYCLSYERAIPIARVADHTALSMFSTYTSETFRSMGANAQILNTDRVLANELEAAGEIEAAKHLRIGMARRATGMGIATAGGYYASAAAIGVFSTILTSLGFIDPADELDEEEEELVKTVAKANNPFIAEKELKIIGRMKDSGAYIVVDAGRGNPYDPVANVGRLLLEGKPAEALTQTAVFGSPPLQFLLNLDNRRNRVPRTIREGGTVDDAVQWASAVLGVPPEAMYPWINFAEIYAPTQLEATMIEGPASATDFIGYRPLNADPIRMLSATGIGKSIADKRGEIRTQLRNRAFLNNDTSIERLVAGVVEKELEIYRTANAAVRLARKMGIEEPAIKEALDKSSIVKEAHNGILRSNFVPTVLSERVLTSARDAASEGLSPQEAREVRARFKKLEDRLKELRNKAKLTAAEAN